MNLVNQDQITQLKPFKVKPLSKISAFKIIYLQISALDNQLLLRAPREDMSILLYRYNYGRIKALQRADTLRGMCPTIVSSLCICLMTATERIVRIAYFVSAVQFFSWSWIPIWVCTHENHEPQKILKTKPSSHVSSCVSRT